MYALVEDQKKRMEELSCQLLLSKQNNLLLASGHMALRLDESQLRFNFACERPVLMTHLEGNCSIVSGRDNSADVI